MIASARWLFPRIVCLIHVDHWRYMAQQSEFKLLDRRTLPEGFRYQPDVISAEEEHHLLQQIRHLPFQAFQFRGFEGKRRTVSYGWRYDFNQQKLQQADPVAEFLRPVR